LALPAISDHLHTAPDQRRCDLDAVDLALHRAGVVLGERDLAAGAEPHAARRDGSGQHDDQVRAETADLPLDARSRPGADGHHGHDGGDTDDDAAKRLIEAEVVDREALLALIAASETPRPPPMARSRYGVFVRKCARRLRDQHVSLRSRHAGRSSP
jgi:hypothetical protein